MKIQVGNLSPPVTIQKKKKNLDVRLTIKMMKGKYPLLLEINCVLAMLGYVLRISYVWICL
jgi:hypothetical protein